MFAMGPPPVSDADDACEVFVADPAHTTNVCPFCNRGFKLEAGMLLEAQLQQENDERQA